MSSQTNPDRLYQLLPALYREQDEALGNPLRDLLRLVAEQADLVQTDIQQLWDDFFIETCQPWVIPYIGDLVSNRLLHDAQRQPGPDTARLLFPDLVGRNLRSEIAIRTRADVAKTIYYRRRKGTLPMLEELARDITGWAAHAVEFFELLNWTQNLNHIRYHSSDCPDLRSVEVVDRLNSAFDAFSHFVDLRSIQQPEGQPEGWYNIRQIGFFLWRLRSYPLRQVPARVASQPWQFHFSPLGNPAPLFSQWRREGDEAGLATELHIPAPIRPAFFYTDLERYQQQPIPRPDSTDLYGLFAALSGSSITRAPEASLFIVRNGIPVLPSQIRCQALFPWPPAPPTGQRISVDVRSGRLAIGDGWADATERVEVYFHYGFSADLGGGPYERGKWLVRPELATLQFRVKQDGMVPTGTPPVTHTSLVDALSDWAAAIAAWTPTDPPPNAIITILDSRTYDLPDQIQLSNEHWLVIEAANGERPLLQTNSATGLEVQVRPPTVAGDPARRSELSLSGVVVEGFVTVNGDLGRLRLMHTTLVPGRSLNEDGLPTSLEPSLIVAAQAATGERINTKLQVQMAFSITGPLRLPVDSDGLWVLDSIIDGLGGTAIAAPTATEPGPPTTLERTTILGTTLVKQLPLATEVIFTQPVIATQTQTGCVRFSYVPADSETPRQYRCQPDLEITTQIEAAEKSGIPLTASERDQLRQEIRGWLVPSFTAIHYGLPAYAQLRLSCPIQIRTGAEDESEMGVFSHLKQPQRAINLRIRLDEYLPFGLDAGLIYVT